MIAAKLLSYAMKAKSYPVTPTTTESIMIDSFFLRLFQRTPSPLCSSSFANDESDHQISVAATISYLLVGRRR